MPSQDIMNRLNKGESLLMDGGTGSELHRRGVEVLVDTTADHMGGWSAYANLDAPDVVQQVHRDYLRVGAEVIISNNFWTSRSKLSRFGLGDRWEEYARAAVENAVKARDAMNPDAYVVGGMAPPVTQSPGQPIEGQPSDVQQLGEDVVFNDFKDHAELMVQSGVDALLPEFMGYIDDSAAAVAACQGFDLPVFLGIRLGFGDGRIHSEEPLAELIPALSGNRVDAILLMCSLPEAITANLPELKRSFDGVIGAYPNVGYSPRKVLGGVQSGLDTEAPSNPDFIREHPYSPSHLAEFAEEWRGMGAQIVGGCCATGPEHIMAMSDVVRGR